MTSSAASHSTSARSHPRFSDARELQPPGEPAAPRGSRRLQEAIGVAAAVAIVFFTCTGAYDLLVGTFNDDGVYVALGKALSSGAGYHSIYLAGDPVQAKYPPGLPALLAILWSLTGSLGAVQGIAVTLSILATAAASGVLWWYARVRLRLHPALAAILAIGPFLLDASTQLFALILTEPYFLLGWAVALVLHERLRDEDVGRDGIRNAVALGVVLALTALIRAQGVLLIALLLPTLRWRGAHRRHALICTAIAALPVLAWQGMHARMIAIGPLASQPDETYGRFIGGAGGALHTLAASLPVNAADYLRLMGGNLSGVPGLGALIFGVAILLAIVGGLRLGRAHPALVLSVLVNTLAVLAWPFTQDRLLLPVLPFAGVLAAGALAPIADAGSRKARLAMWVPLVAALLVIGVRQPLIRYEAAQAPPGDRVSTESPSFLLPGLSRYTYVVSRWVLAHTKPGDRILVSNPSAIYLYTGRQAVPAQPSENRIAPTLFGEPGRYFATRIVRDSITIVLLEDPRSQSASEVAGIQHRCPGALHYLGSIAPNVAPLFFAADPGDACLQRDFQTDH